MYNVNVIAETILSYGSIDPKKLQKLCYYVQAHYLAKYSNPLIDTSFEAWVHGPVSSELYRKYKTYGWSNIPQTKTNYYLPKNIEEHIIEVYRNYAMYSADELEEYTHDEEPWLLARKGLLPYQSSNNIITNESMEVYYKENH
jgi:uncharacterized phage-associated protein